MRSNDSSKRKTLEFEHIKLLIVMITEWWSSMDLLMKSLWCIAIATSLIFLIQTIMTFIGVDTDTSADFDFSADADTTVSFDGDPSTNLLTFRNFVNFFLGFSWAGILLHGKFSSEAIGLVIAIVIGIALVTAVMMLFKWLSGMQQSGTINLYKSAVGCNGKVYLTIPAERKGTGKVQISINGAVREYDAMTDADTIKTGTPIHVTEVIDAETLLVEPLESYIV